MRRTTRHLRYLLLAALAAALLLPTPAAADDAVVATDKMQAAEAKLLDEINQIRVEHGRKPLRLDKRTSHVARSRSLDMAAKRYFAHVEPDGDDAEEILERREIPAREVTENIGHTVGLTLRAGTRRMANWWYRSPPHRVQMLARDVNYVGVGIARHGSRFTYTAIFTRSRDKTSPRVAIDEATWEPDEIGSKVVIDFEGVDPSSRPAPPASSASRSRREARSGSGVSWTATRRGRSVRSARSSPATRNSASGPSTRPAMWGPGRTRRSRSPLPGPTSSEPVRMGG